MIRAATQADAAAIARIYNHYILHTPITFEEDPLTDATMAGRIAGLTAKGYPWLVAEEEGSIAGYAYAAAWKDRPAYRYSVEDSVYLAPEHTGRGFGARLFAELLAQVRQRGFHLVIGGIALPNTASIALHEKFGLTKAAHFAEVGFKFGRWIDVGYWAGRP